MCGIAGFFNAQIRPEERADALGRMLSAMHHRGPDDTGTWTNGDLAMGMKRLAIFDPARGKQPMTSADARHVILFNGAIYNHRELRRDLEGQGYVFRTDCDTEVLLNLWNQHGEAALPRLRGMFAFAVWDNQQRSLTLVRDPLGIKPLYVSDKSGHLLFASELNALRASDHFDTTISAAALDAYLARLAVPAPLTIYRNARSLEPGEMAIWREGELKFKRYWRLPGPAKAREQHSPAGSPEEFGRELRSRLEDSIAAHRLADVPVGTFLSGGLDSAITTGLMARTSGDRLKTFSIGFEESEFSELGAAEETAAHLGTDHQSVVLTGPEAVAQLGDYLGSLDQPTGDGFNTWLVSRAARQGGVTAALSGLGGDELFGGYPSFRHTPRIAGWLPAWRTLPRALREFACRRLDRGDTARRKLAGILRHASDLHGVANRQREVFGDEVRRQLLGTAPTDDGGAVHPADQELRAALAGAGNLAAISAWEMRTYMHDVLLRDSDVFSMRASLELRVPLVDRPLIEWLAAQPDALRFDANFPKGALYAATADILPPGLRDRPKRGFTLPFPRWMRGPMRPFIEDTLTSTHLRDSGWLDAENVMNIWIQFRDGEDDRQWSRVWSLVVLAHFLSERSRT